jgi:transketolase N-terminal domain/subunit
MGWKVFDVNGHDIEALATALTMPQDRRRLVVVRTVKGRGSFMENRLE